MASEILSSSVPSADWTVADLLDRFDVPADRIRIRPSPGTATEADVISIGEREGYLCELVDGTLVEKTMGAHESLVAGFIIQFLNDYLQIHRIGQALSEGGSLRMLGDEIRIPDACYISWERRGRGRLNKASHCAEPGNRSAIRGEHEARNATQIA